MLPLSREALTPLRNAIVLQYSSGAIKVDRLKALNAAEIKIQGMFADELDRRAVKARLALLSADEIGAINSAFLGKLKAAQSAQDVLHAIDARINSIAAIANEKRANALEGCATLFDSFEQLAAEKEIEDNKAAQKLLIGALVSCSIDSAIDLRTKELVAQEKQEKIIESRQAAQQLLVESIVSPAITGALLLRSKEIEAQLRQEKIIEKEEKKKAGLIEQALREKQTKIKHFAAFQARSVTYLRKIKSASALHHEELTRLVSRMKLYCRTEKPGDSVGVDLTPEQMQLKMLTIRSKHIAETLTEISPHAVLLIYSFYSVLQRMKLNFQASRPAGGQYLPLDAASTPMAFLTIEKILGAFSAKEVLALPFSAAVDEFLQALGNIYNLEVGYINTIETGNCKEIDGIMLHFWILRQQATALAALMFESLSKGDLMQRTPFSQLFSDIRNQLIVMSNILKENKDKGITVTFTELLADFQKKRNALDCFENVAMTTLTLSQVRQGLFSARTAAEPSSLQQKSERMIAHISTLCQSVESTAVALSIFVLQDYELRYRTIRGLEKTTDTASFGCVLRTYISLCYQAVYVAPERQLLMNIILQRAIYQREIDLVHERCFPRMGNCGLICHNKASDETIDLGMFRSFFENMVTADVRITLEDLVQAKLVSEKQGHLLEVGIDLYLVLIACDIDIEARSIGDQDYCKTLKIRLYAELLTMLNTLLTSGFSATTVALDVLSEQCMSVCNRLQELATLIATHEPHLLQMMLRVFNITPFRNSVMLVLDEAKQLAPPGTAASL